MKPICRVNTLYGLGLKYRGDNDENHAYTSRTRGGRC